MAENQHFPADMGTHSNQMFSWTVQGTLESSMRLSEIADLRLSQFNLQRRVISEAIESFLIEEEKAFALDSLLGELRSTGKTYLA